MPNKMHEAPGEARGPATGRWRGWPLARRAVALAFLLVVAAMLISQARRYDWPRVIDSMLAYDSKTLLLAATLAMFSFVLYGCFDLLARIHTGHVLSRALTFLLATISYAFTLNLGALVGSVGFRYRLYGGVGIKPAVIAHIVSFSIVTNWVGHTFLTGLILLFVPPQVPPDLPLGQTALRWLGALCLLLSVAYLLACAFANTRAWRIRGVDFHLPGIRQACAQIGISVTNWLLVAATLFVLLPGHTAFVTVLGIYLVAAIAGAFIHMPAGLGVIEAVFIIFLKDRIAPVDLLAAILAFRAVYYLLPLCLAIAAFLVFEVTIRSRRRRSSTKPTARPGTHPRPRPAYPSDGDQIG